MFQLSAALTVLALMVVGSQAAPDPLPRPRPVAVAAAKAHQQQQQQLPVPVAATADEAFFGRCPNGSDWVSFRQHCYLHVERPEYWYVAEQRCKAHGGHLASISTQDENIFLSKLSYCQTTWIGRYAVNVDQLNSPTNYRWTDLSAYSFSAHNYRGIVDKHQPLIVLADLQWENRVYHDRNDYLCKVPNSISGTVAPSRCQPGWTQHNGHCYYMPDVSATYIEADFYCRGKSAHLASLHTHEEVRLINLLDLKTNSCSVDTWIGLVKLNPCRVDFSTGNKVCFKWSDRQPGDYKDFPKWHPGSPNNDEVTNCVVLKDRAIKSVYCYQRSRFVCKKPV